MEESLHDVPLYREFAGLGDAVSRLPDETTILRFRHLMEAHDLAVDMLRVVNDILQAKGLLLRTGTAVDATLIIGVDAQSGLVHTVVGTAADVSDINVAGALLHGEEQAAFGDAGYQGVHKRTGQRPDHRAAVLVASHRRGLPRRGRAFRLGPAQRHARCAPRRRMAHRHGLRDGHLPVLPHAGRRGAHHAHARRPRQGRDRGARNGHGHGHRADAGHGGAARPGSLSDAKPSFCVHRHGEDMSNFWGSVQIRGDSGRLPRPEQAVSDSTLRIAIVATRTVMTVPGWWAVNLQSICRVG
jgi:IS5 family transposase